MKRDNPPSDETILELIGNAGGQVDPGALMQQLSAEFDLSSIIEALQRGIERRKITLNNDGMIVVAQELAKVA